MRIRVDIVLRPTPELGFQSDDNQRPKEGFNGWKSNEA